MATTTDFHNLSTNVLKQLGGAENITSVTHCATRLRFQIKDNTKVNTPALEAVDGVIAVVKAGGQTQVVIGNEVPHVYAAVVALPGMATKDVKNRSSNAEDDNAEPKGALAAFVDLISALFTPILWPLAGIALIKAVLSMGTTLEWFGTESTNYIVFNAIADGLFYFLPLFLAITAARKFKVNEFIAMATVAPLVYPSIVAFAEAEEPLKLLGIPLVGMNYTSSVIPAIITVWLAGYVQRFFERILPAALRNFLTPAFVVLIMVPLVLLTVGPATTYAAQGISAAVMWIFDVAPWLAGGLLGAFWQVLVMFGLHWGFVPIMLNELATNGTNTISAPLQAAVLAQAAATLAVAIRTHVVARRTLAGPASVSGLIAGITEPAIYGVNLPLKVPFIAGCVGGAVGGIIIGISGTTFNAFVFPSLLAFPAGLGSGNFSLFVIGSVVAMVIAFVVTWVRLPQLERDEATRQEEARIKATTTETSAVEAGPATLYAPVAGTLVPTEQIADKVFSSGAMGQTIAIEPAHGIITAPVAGVIIAAPKSGHAFGIKGDNGLEVLVHVGIDTVKLEGEGFSPAVAVNDHVEVGQPLVEADLAAIANAGYLATTITIITNSTKLGDFDTLTVGNEVALAEPVLRQQA